MCEPLCDGERKRRASKSILLLMPTAIPLQHSSPLHESAPVPSLPVSENPSEIRVPVPLRPRPARLNTVWQTFGDIRVTLRPIRPSDAPREQAFVRALSPESRYLRFMGSMRELTPQMLVQFTQIDYDRKMAYIATMREGGHEVQIGVCRYVAIPGSTRCEFALTVADRWHRQGLGTCMMTLLTAYARSCGFRCMFGSVLGSNHAMLSLCKALGFVLEDSNEGPQVRRAVLCLGKA